MGQFLNKRMRESNDRQAVAERDALLETLSFAAKYNSRVKGLKIGNVFLIQDRNVSSELQELYRTEADEVQNKELLREVHNLITAQFLLNHGYRREHSAILGGVKAMIPLEAA